MNQINPTMTIEQLAHLRYNEGTNNAYVEYKDFIISWASQQHLSVSIRFHLSNPSERGKILEFFWRHQLHSLDEWNCIQIALNSNGHICFLRRINESPEDLFSQIIQTIKMIQNALAATNLSTLR